MNEDPMVQVERNEVWLGRILFWIICVDMGLLAGLLAIR